MEKLYYKDPSRALHMARQFHVELVSGDGKELFPIEMRYEIWFLSEKNAAGDKYFQIYQGNGLYVSEKSYDILKPKDQDKARDSSGIWTFCGKIQAWEMEYIHYSGDGKVFTAKQPHELPISRRDDKLFFMPDNWQIHPLYQKRGIPNENS